MISKAYVKVSYTKMCTINLEMKETGERLFFVITSLFLPLLFCRYDIGTKLFPRAFPLASKLTQNVMNSKYSTKYHLFLYR